MDLVAEAEVRMQVPRQIWARERDHEGPCQGSALSQCQSMVLFWVAVLPPKP